MENQSNNDIYYKDVITSENNNTPENNTDDMIEIPIDLPLPSPSPINKNYKPFLEFSREKESISEENKLDIANTINSIDSTDSTDNIDNADSINLLDNGSYLYDIIHFFDDMYVSGRTFIENNYFNLSSNDDFNLVYPNIYIGNYSTTTNLELLKSLGITHIISVIPSFNPPFEDKFKYLHISAYDDDTQDMKPHFDTTNEFIKECILQGGKVLIHCMVGRSRSVTIFIAFLIFIIRGNLNQCIVKIEDERININENMNDDINQNINEYDINQYNNTRNLIEYRKL